MKKKDDYREALVNDFIKLGFIKDDTTKPNDIDRGLDMLEVFIRKLKHNLDTETDDIHKLTCAMLVKHLSIVLLAAYDRMVELSEKQNEKLKNVIEHLSSAFEDTKKQ